MNFSFFMGGMMALVAMACSAMRGKQHNIKEFIG